MTVDAPAIFPISCQFLLKRNLRRYHRVYFCFFSELPDATPKNILHIIKRDVARVALGSNAVKNEKIIYLVRNNVVCGVEIDMPSIELSFFSDIL